MDKSFPTLRTLRLCVKLKTKSRKDAKERKEKYDIIDVLLLKKREKNKNDFRIKYF